MPQLKGHKHSKLLQAPLTKECQGPLANGRLLHARHAEERGRNHSHTPEDKAYKEAASHTALQAQPWQHTANQVVRSMTANTAACTHPCCPLQGLHQLLNSINLGHTTIYRLAAGQRVLDQQHATASHESAVEQCVNVTWLRVPQRSHRH